MNRCENCLMYSKSYDELRATYNDIAKGEIPHTCIMYEDGIDPKVFEGEKKCPHYVAEKE